MFLAMCAIKLAPHGMGKSGARKDPRALQEMVAPVEEQLEHVSTRVVQ